MDHQDSQMEKKKELALNSLEFLNTVCTRVVSIMLVYLCTINVNGIAAKITSLTVVDK